MQLATRQTTARSDLLPVSLDALKIYLRVRNPELDTDVNDIRHAAVEYCERAVNRSLRVSHTLTDVADDFPAEGCWRFLRQPVKSITSVKYYDLDNAQQTVTSSNYRLIESTDSRSWLEFDETYSFPSVYDRADCVEYIYLAGYDTIADVPAPAKMAVKVQASILFGQLSPIQQAAAERARDSLLASVDWWPYV